MKVLFIGHYREGGGWAKASIDFIQALDSIGIDIVCRNVSLTNKYVDIPQRVIELENKSLDNVDYCIQHVLPHHLVSTVKFKKNIAYFEYETNNMKQNEWTNNLHLVDGSLSVLYIFSLVFIFIQYFINSLLANGNLPSME